MIRNIDWPATTKGDVALFDYESAWAWRVSHKDISTISVVLTLQGLRRPACLYMLSPAMAATRLDDYALCLVPGLFTCGAALSAALAKTKPGHSWTTHRIQDQ